MHMVGLNLRCKTFYSLRTRYFSINSKISSKVLYVTLTSDAQIAAAVKGIEQYIVAHLARQRSSKPNPKICDVF
jgi:hypothetical protein